MPLRLPPPEGPDFKIYHALKWGDLAEFWLLDTRQYRDDQNCGDIDGMGCAGWDTWEGTLLGAEQEQWLFAGMKASAAIWKVIAQQLIFSTVDSGGNLVNFDQWDGYPVARQRILDFLSAEQIADVVVLSGDFHLGGVGDLTADAHDQDSPVVAAEVVTTSMGSLGDIPAETLEAVVGPLKNIKYVNAHSRGYSSHELTREVYTVRMVIADTVEAPTSPTSVEFEGYIDAGTPGLRPTP
jgi:alkaline phosphatase D